MRSKYAHLAATRQSLETELDNVTERARRLSEESATLRAELHALTVSNDRAELEERLRQSLRGEEVGHLAAAMAPELDTVLKAVGEHSARLVQSLGASDGHRQDAEAIRTGSMQAIGMLRQLQAFSRRQLQPLPATDIIAVVERAQPMLARLCGTEVDLSMHLGPAAVVAVTQEDLEQLVTTLVFSARERLTVAGSLLVESSIVEPDQVASNGKGPGAAPAARRFRLTAMASGYGVQPPQPSSALELIVRRCGGELHLDGTPGRTSVLHAYLPVVSGPADTSKTQ
jgi:two-component system cell cycle sensor histidine kinase/response regulator CckA